MPNELEKTGWTWCRRGMEQVCSQHQQLGHQSSSPNASRLVSVCSWKVLAKSWLKTTDLRGFSFHIYFHCWNYLVTNFSSSVFFFAQNGNCGFLSKSLKTSIGYFKCVLCQQWDKLLKGQAGSLLDRPAPREAHSSFLLFHSVTLVSSLKRLMVIPQIAIYWSFLPSPPAPTALFLLFTLSLLAQVLCISCFSSTTRWTLG